MMMNHLDSRFFDSIDALVPAPMYHKKLKKRGYNQAEELARALSKSCALPVITDWLVRVRDTTPQSGLSIDARENNLVGAFALRGERDINSVLIIDDIYTTGATINACGKTLAAGGARAVRSLTLAIALKHIDDNAVLMK
jgi:ComF family protein